MIHIIRISGKRNVKSMELYVVSYDISLNKLRNKISKLLESYGIRVQYSVFECNLKPAEYRKMKKDIIKMMEGSSEGQVRIYSICGNCKEKADIIGENNIREYTADNQVIIV